MIGTIRWNFIFGAVGFVITFFSSWSNNVWTTSIIRGIIAFCIWFALGFALRFIAGILQQPQQEQSSVQETADKGQTVDMTTPDESDMLHDLLLTKPSEEKQADREDDNGSAFQPLNPPKLVTKPQMDAEQLAQAVRHLTQK
ncbi:hypothetical protein [Paenibacillus apiarius]|uniref:hypothetical protein n=1 Tax=Paenibacillus apiarius TaxID=46240 RepID=UPI0019809CB3|nr:hypothetical protein [Paenibacillus apiarius]MBN3526216.1 hypothetical protein [Paenibacillus apiarius]